MRFVFLGTPETAVPALETLVRSGRRPELVVTQPDRPVGRGRRASSPAVKRCALEHGLEVHQPDRVRGASFRQRLEACAPDVLVVVAYGRILPGAVLQTAPRGAVNLHFSLLPRYRGAAPVQWALARGESVTGVTTMRMNEKMDEGDILLARSVAIEQGEHAPALAHRLAEIGAGVLDETLTRIDTLRPEPQDHAAATLAPLLCREDGEVDPAVLDAREIEGRVRGFDPWPGVWLGSRAGRLRLVDARALDERRQDEAPGTIFDAQGDRLVMACREGSCLTLTAVQLEGKRVLSARDAINGRVVGRGDRLRRIERAP